MEFKKIYDSLIFKWFFDKGFDKLLYFIDIEFKYILRWREFSKEINLGLSLRVKELFRGRLVGSVIDIGRLKFVLLGWDVSFRFVLDDKKGYYIFCFRLKLVFLLRDFLLYDNRVKLMSVVCDFGIKFGYELDKEDMYGVLWFWLKFVFFLREFDFFRWIWLVLVVCDFVVKLEIKFKDEYIYNKRDGRVRLMFLLYEIDEFIWNLWESSVGRLEFVDIEVYRVEFYNK